MVSVAVKANTIYPADQCFVVFCWLFFLGNVSLGFLVNVRLLGQYVFSDMFTKNQ